MTPLTMVLIFLFAVLLVGATAILIAATTRRAAEAAAEAAAAAARTAERTAAPQDMAGLRQAAGLNPAGDGQGSIFRPLPGGGYYTERWGHNPAAPVVQPVTGQVIPAGGITINNYGGQAPVHNGTPPPELQQTDSQEPKPWHQQSS